MTSFKTIAVRRCASTVRRLFLLVAVVLFAVVVDAQESQESPSAKYTTESIRGRFVWLTEAQERLHGIKSVPEAQDRILALETPDGELFPLIEDVRGRAFRKDKRLRELKDCELTVARYPGSPMVQIIHLYSHEDGTKYELDYFCEICSIVMFELKPCDCCQGEIELRRRKVEE